MPRLTDRFTALWQKFIQPSQVTTTAEDMRAPSRPSAMVKALALETDRSQIVKLCRDMYSQDSRCKNVLSTLARDCIKGGYQLQIIDGPMTEPAYEAAQQLQQRLGLLKRLDDWARLTFRDGDSFLELSPSADGVIQQVSRKPTLEMHRASDETDLFPEPRRAFWWADTLWGTMGAPEDATWFAEWQIIHARWDHDEGSKYGTPLFAASRAPWKKMREGETDVAIRRKTRSGIRYLHTLEGASPAELQKYRNENQVSLDNPFAAVTDFFSNVKGSLQTVSGDANLGEIADIMHHISTWWQSSPVPMEAVGYGKDLNRDVLGEKMKQYERALETVSDWLSHEVLLPLLERQWLLLGIYPPNLEYEIVWAVKQAMTAELLGEVANALIRLKTTKLFDAEDLLNLAAQVMPGIDVQVLLEKVKEREAEEQARRDDYIQILQTADRLEGEQEGEEEPEGERQEAPAG